MKPAHLTGIVLALSAAAIYGAVPNFARLAFLNGVPALETVFYRTSAVALVLGLVAVARGESFRLTRISWPSFVISAASACPV